MPRVSTDCHEEKNKLELRIRSIDPPAQIRESMVEPCNPRGFPPNRPWVAPWVAPESPPSLAAGQRGAEATRWPPHTAQPHPGRARAPCSTTMPSSYGAVPPRFAPRRDAVVWDQRHTILGAEVKTNRAICHQFQGRSWFGLAEVACIWMQSHLSLVLHKMFVCNCIHQNLDSNSILSDAYNKCKWYVSCFFLWLRVQCNDITRILFGMISAAFIHVAT